MRSPFSAGIAVLQGGEDVNDALLQTDGMRLRRMIENVLSKAIKYSRPGGKILLASRVHRGKLRVEVWDQGIGIPADKIGQVFSEFYRADAAKKLAPDGMGIGLSLVARLAEALNTKLTIASVEGRGTRVTMEIGDVDPDPEKRKLNLAWGRARCSSDTFVGEIACRPYSANRMRSSRRKAP